MLVIRQAQLELLAENLITQLEQELLSRVRQRCPDSVQALGPALSQALIRRCVRLCRAQGFGDRGSITRAVDGLFGQQRRLLASSDAALVAVLLELEAERLRSLLETAADIGVA